jgi:hypothetical protein
MWELLIFCITAVGVHGQTECGSLEVKTGGRGGGRGGIEGGSGVLEIIKGGHAGNSYGMFQLLAIPGPNPYLVVYLPPK